MRSKLSPPVMVITLAFIAIAFITPAVCRAVTVMELYHVDPFYESGGYYEFEVINDSADDIYLVLIGNTGATVLFVRPDLATMWYADYCNAASWGPECPNLGGVSWTPPDFSGVTFASLFGTSEQVIFYYATGSTPPIPSGGSLVGFRWMPPAPGAAPLSAVSVAGSPFAVYNGSGQLVAQGVTVGSPVATDSKTWGGIKALFRD